MLARARGVAPARIGSGAKAVRSHSERTLRAVGALVLATLVGVGAWATLSAGPSRSVVLGRGASGAGAAATGWATLPASVRQGLTPRSPAFWATRTTSGVAVVRNPVQGLAAGFSHGRVAVQGADGLRLGLSSLSIGRGGARFFEPAFGAAVVVRSRVVFAVPGVAEWFTNGPDGIEQGFTVTRRAAGSGPLLISQKVAGNLVGRVGPGGQSVTFASHRGLLRYENLSVTDATGSRVPARMSIAGRRLTIAINDRHAVYPLRVDPSIVAAITSAPGFATIDYGGANTDTLTVTGTDPDGGTPTGAVSFYACGPTGLPLGSSSCSSEANQVGVGPVALVATGSDDAATATSQSFTPAGGPGVYCFYAVYAGDSNYDGASDSTSDGCFTVLAAPSVVSTSPSSGLQGAADVNVDVHGSGFEAGADATFSNPGITVNSTTFVSSVSLTANISIDSGAGTGPSAVTVTNPDGSTGTGSGAFEVDAAPTLTVTVAGTQTYGGGGKAFSITGYSGFEGGDGPGVVTGSLSCSTSVTAGDAAGTYHGSISSCGGLSAAGYEISYLDGGFTVTPAALTITASSPTMTYGGAVPAITPGYSGLVNGDSAPATAPTCFTTASASSPAGSAPATLCADASDPNYAISYVTGAVTVRQADLLVTASSPAMTYGGAVPTITPIYSGFEDGDGAGDLPTQPVCATTASPTSAPGSAPATSCTGPASDGNYTVTYSGGAVTINAAPLSVLVSGSETYGGGASFDAGFSGFVNGQGSGVLGGSLSGCTTTAGAAAGFFAGTISGCGGLSDSNYTISYVDQGFTVKPAPLQITASSPAMGYGDAVPAITPGYSGLEHGDMAPSTTPVCTTTATSSSPVGSYATRCIGALDPNYTISYVNGSVQIAKADLSVTASSPAMTYGGAVPVIAPVYSGFKAGDGAGDLPSQPVCSTTATSSSAVSSSPTTSCTGPAVDGNYAVSYVVGSVTVDRAPLTAWVDGTQVYGGSPSYAVSSFTGFVNGDGNGVVSGPPVCTTSVPSSAGAGSYLLTLTACHGLLAANYTIAYADNGFTVKPALLTITASSPTMTYGGAVPAITPGYSGLVNNDSAPATAPTCFTTASASSPFGSSPATVCDDASDPDYTISYVNGSVQIAKADLSVTASSPAMTYGGPVPVIVPIYSGFVDGEGASALPSQPICVTTATSSSTVSSSPTTSCSGPAVDGNYSVSYAGGNVTVNRAPLTAWVDGSQVYGGAPGYAVASYTGLVNGDGNGVVSGTPVCTTSVPSDAGAGSYLLTLSACHGLSAANYTIVYADNGFKVTPAPLQITASSPTMTYGGAVPAVMPGYVGLVNGDSAPATTPTCFTTAVPSSPAGSTPPTLCDDASDPNYTITYKPGFVTVNQAPLQITASSATILYGGVVPAITPSYSGFVNDDSTTSLTTLPTCSTATTSLSPASVTPYVTSCLGPAIDGNYAVAYVPGTITVNQAPLTITVTGQRIYGGMPSFQIYSYSGFVNSQTPSVLSTTLLSGCTTTTTGTTPAGVYAGKISGCGGPSDPNYAITFADGGFTVTDAATSSISALPLASIAVGDSNSDSVVVTGNVVGGAPTGTVSFYECVVQTFGVNPCTSGGTQIGPAIALAANGADTSKATSATFTPASGPGTYCLRAQYSGDHNYDGSADGTTDECFAVSQVGAPSTSSPTSSTIVLGALNTDNVTVAGNQAGGSPTGQVTFYACSPGTSPCSSGGTKVGLAVDLSPSINFTSTATSPSFLPASGPGTYCFRAVYSGDSNYVGSSDGTGGECFTVTKATSSSSSAPSAPTIEAGGSLADNLTVHGNAAGGSPTGSVSVYVCGPPAGSCSSTATPVGGAVTLDAAAGDTATARSASFTPSGGSGTYCFYAVYGGDSHYLGSSDATSDACFSVTTAPSQVSSSAPTNAFSITSHTFKKNAIELSLTLPGAGKLVLSATHSGSANTLARRTINVSAEGQLSVKLSLNKDAKAAVASATMRAVSYHATVTVTYTPVGGAPATKTLTVLLAR
jgi:hypothetical protein